MISKMDAENNLRRSLLGLTAILLVEPGQQNPVIISNMKVITNEILNIAKKISDKKNNPIKAQPNKEIDEEENEAKFEKYLKQVIASIILFSGPATDTRCWRRCRKRRG